MTTPCTSQHASYAHILRAHLDNPAAVSIGTAYTLRAIVVPVPNFNPWAPACVRRSFARAKKALNLRLDQLKKATAQ